MTRNAEVNVAAYSVLGVVHIMGMFEAVTVIVLSKMAVLIHFVMLTFEMVILKFIYSQLSSYLFESCVVLMPISVNLLTDISVST